jgi:cob(I)alamin adenosyltransferase
MKIYTKTGDKGQTSLIGGKKVSKAHLKIESYGTVDELNSFIGLVRSRFIDDEKESERLVRVQNILFNIGAVIVTSVKVANDELQP